MVFNAFPPRGVFKGRNFMTPDLLGYARAKKPDAKGLTVWVELSTGTGFEGEPIFGVTVRNAHGDHVSPDPSKMFFSRAAAEEYAATL